METKKDIRAQVFIRRKEAAPRELAENSAAICRKVTELEAFQKSSLIYLYADVRGEVSTEAILLAAKQAGKQVAVPRVEGRQIRFYLMDSFEQLEAGYFQIPEPKPEHPASGTGVFMVMPGVAFDKNCGRVGYGGGFYDRYLEAHPDTVKAALAFDFQIFEQVPCTPEDICPDMVITETAIYKKEETIC